MTLSPPSFLLSYILRATTSGVRGDAWTGKIEVGRRRNIPPPSFFHCAKHVNRHRRWVMMTHRRGRPLFHVCLFMRFVNGLREKQGENKTVRAKLRAGRLERERERACGQDEKRKAAPSLARVTALLCGRAGEGESGHRFVVTHVRGERVHATHVTTTAQQ